MRYMLPTLLLAMMSHGCVRYHAVKPQSTSINNPHAAFDNALHAMTDLGLTPANSNRDSGVISTEWSDQGAGNTLSSVGGDGYMQIRYTVTISESRASVSIQQRSYWKNALPGMPSGYQMVSEVRATPEAIGVQKALLQAVSNPKP